MAPVKWEEYYSPNIFLQSVEKDYTGYPIKVKRHFCVFKEVKKSLLAVTRQARA